MMKRWGADDEGVDGDGGRKKIGVRRERRRAGDETARRFAPRRGRLRHGGDGDAERRQRRKIRVLRDGAEADEGDALDQSERLRLTVSSDSSSRARPRRASASEITSGGLMRREGL